MQAGIVDTSEPTVGQHWAYRVRSVDRTVTPVETLTVAGATVEMFGRSHAVIHPDIPVIRNNAYLIDGPLLPTGAPWLELSEARRLPARRGTVPGRADPRGDAGETRPALRHVRVAGPGRDDRHGDTARGGP